MPDFSVLVSVPTESVAVRAILASLVGLALVALLLRMLQSARVRVAAVLVPIAAIVAAVVWSSSELLLPAVMTATDGEGGLPVLVRDAYVRFAPVGWPLFAFWAAVVTLRILRRVVVLGQMRLVAAAGVEPGDERVNRTVARLARQMRLPEPKVAVVDGCPGGAIVVGLRQSMIVIDARVLATLDDQELEGLLAHELAHVRRRDNLLALSVGLVRDAAFFVPGGRWVVRRLCAERELAADQLAVGATGRPGALASGLLKVLDVRQPSVACAAFGDAALVRRVERLVGADRPAVGPARHAAELGAVAAVLALAVASAIHLPAAVAGQTGQRDALAVVWSWARAPAEEPPRVPEATAFAVFRQAPVSSDGTASVSSAPAGDGDEFHPSYLRGLRPVDGQGGTSVGGVGEKPIAQLEGELIRRWRATPVVRAEDGVGLYWLERLESDRGNYAGGAGDQASRGKATQVAER